MAVKVSGKVAVLGGGAWGTALANVARLKGKEVSLWARNPILAENISRGSNPQKLPDAPLASGIQASTDAEAVLSGAESILMAIPAQFARSAISPFSAFIPEGLPIAICAKGIERGSLKRMTEVLGETVPQARLCVLSGPTFAREVVRGLPTAITLAAEDQETAYRIQSALGGDTLRTYLSDDPVGAEIGGAVKNVIALAAGIATGRGLGENARAALVSRGLAEMMRLAVAMGGKSETIMGLAGAGDLILTAMSEVSRNTSFGIAIGKGHNIQHILANRGSVTEGYWTTQAVVMLSQQAGIDMPITSAVHAILEGHSTVDDTISRLMDRPTAPEFPIDRFSEHDTPA